ncbi:hypothetical protein I302_104462 [Kwoniella bestiolae CBS 10118]|uniref:Uncharacterized protein n=1 Tax=Kwoniella bestiolae CBS 10118 TaxID=1296100 RepID=A0A1B9GBC2_9TREE|nr:hypothetical protein I302_03166 [Kwoniella bestiolae CBS 10118]OCF28310.1 hypothetical protein I302_03166 [Kwoniella bestiolae CBS 10118]
MDLSGSGLPVSFGKQAPSLPTKPPPAQSTSRGGHSGRGPRGVVGGGKRNNRGRGGGGGMGNGGGDQGYMPGDGTGIGQAGFHGGTKRPHPPSPNDSSFSSNRNIPPNFRQDQSFSNGGRGGRGRGGGPRTQHDHGHGGERGFWKDSFMEDPWKQLEKQRARSKGLV